MEQLSVFLAAALAAMVLLAAVRRVAAMPLRWSQAVLWWCNYLVARVWWRVRIEGQLLLPKDRGAVIVANHRSSIDPSFIETLVPRVVHWMVAREYCESKAFGWFLRICEVIPTNRGGIDTAATKQAIRLAAQGGLIGIFPEGRINTTAELHLPARPGAIVVALNARVPIIPCYIEGSPYRGTVWSPLLTPARVRLVVGPPWDLSEYYGRSDDRGVREFLARELMQRIAALADRTPATKREDRGIARSIQRAQHRG